MKGVVERTIQETKPFGLLYGLIEVVGVVFDDTPDDLAKARAQAGPILYEYEHKFNNRMETLSVTSIDRLTSYARTIKIEVPVLCPTETLNPELLFSIPSTFRKLRMDNVSERQSRKFTFEEAVLRKASELGAEVIISDGYMARIDYLHADLGMYGRTLNIHPAPAILGMEYCFRGKDEVMDAIRFAQTNGGSAKTGATLHFVNGEIDDGNAIAYICETPVFAHDREIELMARNYKMAKLPLFVEGLQHYILKIFPYQKT